MALAKKLQEQEDAEMANEAGEQDEKNADVPEDKGKPVTSYIKANLAK